MRLVLELSGSIVNISLPRPLSRVYLINDLPAQPFYWLPPSKRSTPKYNFGKQPPSKRSTRMYNVVDAYCQFENSRFSMVTNSDGSGNGKVFHWQVLMIANHRKNFNTDKSAICSSWNFTSGYNI